MRLIGAFILTFCAVAYSQKLNIADCVDGVHMVFARGTFASEDAGYWLGLAEQIENRIPGSSLFSIPYPASPAFELSEPVGVKLMSEYIERYAAKCPDTPIVPMGFSQGAQVVMDVLCGTSELTYLYTPPMSKKLEHHILGAIVYADLTRTPDKPYNLGSAGQKGQGIFARSNADDCRPFASRLQSYCNVNDPFCDGGLDINQHNTYFTLYNTAAADFIQRLYEHEFGKRR